MQSSASSVAKYLASLPPDRRAAIEAVRRVILQHLRPGFEESIQSGMLSYEVPLARLPDTYNGKPLPLAGLGSQKHHMALYLMCVYSDPALLERFEREYEESGKRLDMGKSCLRFRAVEDLPLDVVGRAIGAIEVDDYVARYREMRAERAPAKKAASSKKAAPSRKAAPSKKAAPSRKAASSKKAAGRPRRRA